MQCSSMTKVAPPPATTTDRRKEIGARIRQRRLDTGLTQLQLAEKVRVTENAITQYETGRAVPKPERLQLLGEALGTSMEWLLTGGDQDQIARAQTSVELAALREIRAIPVEHQATALAAIQGIRARFTKK